MASFPFSTRVLVEPSIGIIWFIIASFPFSTRVLVGPVHRDYLDIMLSFLLP